MHKIKVPASTANMGSGFDSIGMALSLYNEIEFETIDNGLIIETDEGIPTDETNLVYISLKNTLDKIGHKIPGLRIRQTNRIPQTRGLGSSSACVVSGIIAANIIAGGILSTEKMISIATEIEGHPDNVLPAFIGGMAAGALEDGQVRYIGIRPPERLRCCIMVPDFELSTALAREVLPATVELKDAIFNISRAALMVGAVAQGNLELMRVAMQDKLHQQYRKKLIPDFDYVVQSAQECGSLGCCLSGAGPTIIAFLDKDYYQFKQQMQNKTQGLTNNWRIELLDICTTGATWDI